MRSRMRSLYIILAEHGHVVHVWCASSFVAKDLANWNALTSIASIVMHKRTIPGARVRCARTMAQNTGIWVLNGA
jgi:nitrous oxidase accessory protein NosD